MTNEESITSNLKSGSELSENFVVPPKEKKDWIEAMCQREAIPKPERTDTIADFCKEWKISESTYDYQRRKKENRRRIVEIWLIEASNGGNEVLAKLKENALLGKEKSIEMYLKFVLELAENLDIKSDGKVIQIYAGKSIQGYNKTKDEGQPEKQESSEGGFVSGVM